MKIFINFSKGFASTSQVTRMVILLFLINLFFSMILAIPLYNSLKESFGNSLVGENMARGFDYLWWEEFNDQSKGLEKTFSPSIIGKGAILNNLEGLIQLRFFQLPPIILGVGLIYIILHTFLAGGILSVFSKETPNFIMKDFFLGAGTYFIRFLLLAVLSGACFIIMAYILISGLGSILNNLRQNAFSEVTPFYVGLLFNTITLFFFLLIQMIFDYARIKIVIDENRNVIHSARQAFGFVFKHLGSALGLFYLILVANIILAIFYVLLKGFLPQSSWLGVTVVFFFQQIFIFGVIWIRCWLYSSQLELYRYLK